MEREAALPEALSGLRVIDFGQYLAGPLLAMLLGDLGAEIIRVDPPGGPRWDHPLDRALQRGKRRITLDLRDEGDRSIARRLIHAADVVVENFRPGVAERLGIGPERARGEDPELVYCSLPGFAAADPRAGLQGWEGVLCAAAGIYVPKSENPDDDIAYNAIPYASSFGTAVGAHSLLAALIARERGAGGQWVEVPLFDALFEAIGHFGIRVVDGPPPRTPAEFAATGGISPQGGFYRCADGRWIHLCLIQDRHLRAFGERFFPKDWLDDGMADHTRIGGVDTDAGLRASDPGLSARARERFAELFATRTAAEWQLIINQEIKCPTAECLTVEEWLDEGHARAVEAIVAAADDGEGDGLAELGFPFRMRGTPPRRHGPRRDPDADREAILAEVEGGESASAHSAPEGTRPLSAPLDGFKVVDTSQVLAGPTSTRILAEYGASVTKVMSPFDGQIMAHVYTNRGKRSIMLDLKKEAGRDIFLRLARDADVVNENFSLGTTERMGIGESDVRALNPDVVYASLSSYGWWEGWRSPWRGREELGQAVSGMELRWGGRGEAPRMQPFALNDYGAGNWAAVGIMAALLHRLRGGEPQHVHASLAHTATFHMAPFMVTVDGVAPSAPEGQGATGTSPTNRLYRAADRWFFLAAPDSRREALATLLGLPGPSSLTEETLEARFAGAPAEVWVECLVEGGVAAHVVLSTDEVMEDPRVKARGLSVVKDLPGSGPTRLLGSSPRLSRTPPAAAGAPGAPGADALEVLDSIGLDSELGDLEAAGVVYTGLASGVELVGRVRAAI